MKKILLSLFLATAAHADIVGPMPSQVINGAPLGSLTGSLTYALNNALTGTSSSTIDLNGLTGIMLTVTMTGTGLVDIIQSNQNVTYAAQVYSVQVPSTYPIRMEGRYLTIRSNPNNKPTYRMSAFYYGVAGPATTISTAVTVSGSVSVTAMPALTASGITQYTALSYTATDVNLTDTAGAAVPCMVCLASNGGAAAGFKFFFGANGASTTNLTTLGQGHYIAASTTSQCWGPFVSGTHFYGAGVAASSSILVDVQKAQ